MGEFPRVTDTRFLGFGKFTFVEMANMTCRFRATWELISLTRSMLAKSPDYPSSQRSLMLLLNGDCAIATRIGADMRYCQHHGLFLGTGNTRGRIGVAARRVIKTFVAYTIRNTGNRHPFTISLLSTRKQEAHAPPILSGNPSCDPHATPV